jgi:uncharacterized protein
MGFPVRQCAVCRTRGEKKSFFRIVRTPEGKVLFDPGNRFQGRSVYLCRKSDCIGKARQLDAVSRSLKIRTSMNLYTELAEAFNGQKPADWKSLVGFSIRSGKSVFGVTAVLQSAAKGQVRLILLDSGSAEGTRERVEGAGRRAGIPVLLHGGLGPAAGQSSAKVIGIKDPQFSQSILRLFHAS